ncbi:MAG: hypothetical protein N3E51_00635 [Candidatus Micrarchaeota archaeon]|nr:hypothetical protein [Candidatus Micrarchaeota archaeon]
MGKVKNAAVALWAGTVLLSAQPKQGKDLNTCALQKRAVIERILPMKEDLPRQNKTEDSLKVGVVKESNMVKMEYGRKAAIITLQDIYKDLGIIGFDRTYRTISTVQELHIKTTKAKIDGLGIVSLITGRDGVIVLYADAELKTFIYSAMKVPVVYRGDYEDRFHSEKDGIQRPAIAGIGEHGCYWVTHSGGGTYRLYYVPHTNPLLVSTTFGAGSSTKDWNFSFGENGRLQVLDGQKPVLTASTYDGVGKEGMRIESSVKGDGFQRNGASLKLNIIEDTREMAGRDIYLKFSPSQLSELCNIPGNWESSEIVKPLEKVQRGGETFIPHVVIARNGIGVVEVPIVGDYARYYNLLGAPYDANPKNPRDPKYVFAINQSGTIFSAVEVPSVDAKNHNLAVFYLPGMFMMKVQMDGKGDDIHSLVATENGAEARDSGKEVVSAIKIEPLLVRTGSVQQ